MLTTVRTTCRIPFGGVRADPSVINGETVMTPEINATVTGEGGVSGCAEKYNARPPPYVLYTCQHELARSQSFRAPKRENSHPNSP